MAELKSLAKDTAIYGASSIIGKFLNYLLVPVYTISLPASSGGYGVITNMYAIVALLLVLLTFGMETGFFRFANKGDDDPNRVYSTSLLMVSSVSLTFLLLCLLFLSPIADLFGYGEHPWYLGMMLIVIAMDAIQYFSEYHLFRGSERYGCRSCFLDKFDLFVYGDDGTNTGISCFPLLH